jgi:C4-dicarboxylate transporter DctM subunit
VLAGEIMAQGGIARRVVVWVISLIGGVRGSLGVTTVAASELFGAMAHTAVGTVVAVGRMIYPSLRESGYNERFAVGLIASSGAIAVVIPPSIAMILYSLSAQQSAVALFTAGILPSLLIGFVDALFVMSYARIKAVPLTAPARWKDIWKSTREAGWSVGTVVVILGGIYGGIFSPTEAAGIACVYGILVTKFVHRDLSWKGLWTVGVNSMYVTAQIMIIVASAGVFSWILTVNGVPQAAVQLVKGLAEHPWTVLMVLNVFLLIVGCFIDPASAILILTPLLVPICRAYGIDLIHFGVIVALNLAIGMFHPPFGLNIFVVQALTRAPVAAIYLGVIPFVLLALVALVLVTYIPWLSLYLTQFI